MVFGNFVFLAVNSQTAHYEKVLCAALSSEVDKHLLSASLGSALMRFSGPNDDQPPTKTDVNEANEPPHVYYYFVHAIPRRQWLSDEMLNILVDHRDGVRAMHVD